MLNITGGSIQTRVVDGAIVRATDISSSLQDGSLGQDAITTELVLGMPQAAIMPGERILSPVRVPGEHFRYPVFKAEHLFRRDTIRGLREDMGFVDWKPQYENGHLDEYTIAVLKDKRELAARGDAAGVLRVAERSAMLARKIVMLDLEVRRRDLLTTVTNYPVANRLAISGGSEWDAAGGDSRTDVRSMCAVICSGTPLQYSDLTVFLSFAALNAALDDPVFIAARSNYNADTADTAALARYWGVGEVWSANPVISTSEDIADTGSMYSDIAIVYYDSRRAGVGTTFVEDMGELHFGARFVMNEGVALRSFYIDSRKSWAYPWEAMEAIALTNNSLGAIITNCAA